MSSRYSNPYDSYCRCSQFVPDWDPNTCAICKLRKSQIKTGSFSSQVSQPYSSYNSTPNYSQSSPSSSSSYSSNRNTPSYSSYSTPSYSGYQEQPLQQQPLTHHLLNPSSLSTVLSSPAPLPTPLPSAPAPKTNPTITRRRVVKTKPKQSEGGFLSSIFGKFKSQPTTSAGDSSISTPLSVSKNDHHEELDKLINELNTSLIHIGKKPLTLEEKMELRLGLKDMLSNPQAMKALTDQMLQSKSASSYSNPRSSYSSSSSNSILYSTPNIDSAPEAYSSLSSKKTPTFTAPIIPTKKKSTLNIDDLYSSIESTSYSDPMYKVKDPFENDYSKYTNVSSSATTKSDPYSSSSKFDTKSSSQTNTYQSSSYQPSTNYEQNNNEYDQSNISEKIKQLEKELEKERAKNKTLEVDIFNLRYQSGNLGTSSLSPSVSNVSEKLREEIEQLKNNLAEKTNECQRLAMKSFQSSDNSSDKVKQLESMLISKNEELKITSTSFLSLQRDYTQLKSQLNSSDQSSQLEKQKQYQNEIEQKLRQQILSLENKIIEQEEKVLIERNEKMSINIQFVISFISHLLNHSNFFFKGLKIYN